MADARLLESPPPPRQAAIRWYLVSDRALVQGPSQRRLDSLVDVDRCTELGLQRLSRHVGGGFVLVDDRMLCLTVALGLPHPLALPDVTESYRWIGEALAAGLRAEGAPEAAAISVADARIERSVSLYAQPDPALQAACYGSVSPYEVVVGRRKLVGLAQARRKDVALFQIGILLRDQSALADVLVSRDRDGLRAALQANTVGLDQLLPRPADPETLAQRLQAFLDARLG